MITKEQWAKLGQGSVLRYKRGQTWVCRTVLLGPSDGFPASKANGGGVTLIKWQHSRFYNPTTTYFWSDLKDKTEFTGMKVKGELATFPEMRRIKQMFGAEALEMVLGRLNETRASWERIRKWADARYSRSGHP
jgi:hypothetical protein